MTAVTRRFEYQDDKSSKFWEVTQDGGTVTVRYGKTGTAGQTQEKVFELLPSRRRGSGTCGYYPNACI